MVVNLRLSRELRMSLARIFGPDMPNIVQTQDNDQKTRRTNASCPPLNKKII